MFFSYHMIIIQPLLLHTSMYHYILVFYRLILHNDVQGESVWSFVHFRPSELLTKVYSHIFNEVSFMESEEKYLYNIPLVNATSSHYCFNFSSTDKQIEPFYKISDE